jgi:hypothetical protein
MYYRRVQVTNLMWSTDTICIVRDLSQGSLFY